VNRGQNVAEDVSYSGTVAGAIEGPSSAFPPIALSQAYGPAGARPCAGSCAEHHAPAVVRKLLDRHPRGILVNVNFPIASPRRSRGTALVNQGQPIRKLLRLDERQTGAATPISGSPSNAAHHAAERHGSVGHRRTGASP
jgi:5'-nucleotidase